MGLVCTKTHSANRSLIVQEYSTAWLIMKEQLGLFITGFEPNVATTFVQQCGFQNLQANHVLVCLTWLSDLREDQWASCPPECQRGPSLLFLSSISTAHLHHDLPAPISGVSMCNVTWDILPCLGPSPKPTCIALLNRASHLCLCAFLSLARLDKILMLHVIPRWSFSGNLLAQNHSHLNPPQLVYPKRGSSLPQILLTSDCRQAWHAHTY